MRPLQLNSTVFVVPGVSDFINDQEMSFIDGWGQHQVIFSHKSRSDVDDMDIMDLV